MSASIGSNVATRIVIADRGWVWVGKYSRPDDQVGMVRLTDARCIRRWGTSRGLGELVGGPLEDTVLDPVGDILIPDRAVIATILCTRDW